MNRQIIFTAAAVLFMVSCAKEEAGKPQTEDERVVRLSTNVSPTGTKADTPLEKDFNVESYRSDDNSYFFPSTKYVYADGKYTGEVTRYWPVTGNLDFYAVSPVTYKNSSGTDVDLKPSYMQVVVNMTDGTTDMVAARKKGAVKSPDPVQLMFGHKLTKVSFEVKGIDSTKKYVISSIKVNANSSGTYLFGEAEEWTGGREPYGYEFISSEMTIPAGQSGAVPTGVEKYLIPYPNQRNPVTAIVKYLVYETDNPNPIVDCSYGIACSLVTTGWAINKQVLYTLVLKIDPYADKLQFEPMVSDWGEKTKEEASVKPSPKPLSGHLFSVSDSTKVCFAPSNLWWGTKTFSGRTVTEGWHFDSVQYDYPKNWDPDHVGHFYWTKTAEAAYAKAYDDGTTTVNDSLFCDGSDEDHTLTVDGVPGLYALSSAEWKYVTDTTKPARKGKVKTDVTILNNITKDTIATACLVLAPDNFQFDLFGTYTDIEWQNQEKRFGLILLPQAGRRNNGTLKFESRYSLYWTATPHAKDVNHAYYYSLTEKKIGDYNRGYGFPIRLVKKYTGQ